MEKIRRRRSVRQRRSDEEGLTTSLMEKVRWIRSDGEDPIEKVRWRRSDGKGPPEKVQQRRFDREDPTEEI